ncbi:unnamed protein product [Lactuca saligna]|uniref:Uncharacterized protein n=1 Tax=Lactuca saligna TaxID=75948 RepID=A0AA36E0H9_LACSI|nr:unnamed protein product [Lactuca saligna]
MQTIDIPSNEGLIVDDEPNDMSTVLESKASTMTFNIDLDDYSPSPQKESQEHDDTEEAKFSSFPPDPPKDDDTPADTNEANTYEPELSVVFKSKKELVKEAQQKVDEELENDLHGEQLKDNQEVLLEKKSSEISPEETNTWHDEQF